MFQGFEDSAARWHCLLSYQLISFIKFYNESWFCSSNKWWLDCWNIDIGVAYILAVTDMVSWCV